MAGRMDIMEVVGPMALFIGAVCVAAALYFAVTLVRGRVDCRRERDAESRYREHHRRE